MDKIYNIAGLRIRLTEAWFRFSGLAPFEILPDGKAVDIELRNGICAAPIGTARPFDTFDFSDAEAVCRLYRAASGYRFEMQAASGNIWFDIPDDNPIVTTNFVAQDHPALFRFGLWIVFNLRAVQKGIVAIHSSVIVYQHAAVLCLGESGTGKSTHTRLWLNHIPGSFLLNDDSPLVGMHNGCATVFGSPWSGKTPCYRNEHFPIRAFMRLSQAKENRIEKLSLLKAYGALLPSFPPSFIHNTQLLDKMNAVLSGILSGTPSYHLACLPDAAAAELACHTLYETK